MNKRILIFLGVLVVLGLVVVLLVLKFKTKTIASHEFDGTVKEMKDNILSVQGAFIDPESKPIGTADNKPVMMQILIGADTKITRTALLIPSAQDLKTTDGRIDTDKLKTQESTSDPETLRKDVAQGIVGIFTKSAPNINILGQASFTATEINYRVGVFK